MAATRLVFICVANSARSQMAEGLARRLFGTRVSVQSAGSQPTRVHPHAIAVMAEIGIDIVTQTSKPIHAVDIEHADVVITLCADDDCPKLPASVEHLDWPLPDPIAAPPHRVLQSFREVRDELWRGLIELGRQRSWLTRSHGEHGEIATSLPK